jgi:hypothetical protein
MPHDRNPDSSTASLAPNLEDLWSWLAYGMAIGQNGAPTLAKYANEFIIPFLLSTHYFSKIERQKLLDAEFQDSIAAYGKLAQFNLNLANQALLGAFNTFNAYTALETAKTTEAFTRFFLAGDRTALQQLLIRKHNLLDLLMHRYPAAIKAIAPEYGFHFERGVETKVAETDRFYLYQIMPSAPGIKVRNNGKPILILPPYVLGANILAFLPGENRSYAHCYANRGIPTYIRILKDIQSSEALQTMTGEDDAEDTRMFCEVIRDRHAQAVTLNGYCQGGYAALCNLLSGKLDDLVDAFVTCVAPMDGTRSKGLSGFLANLPQRFNDLAYGSKTLPNGNTVADGKLMGWVYKLKSIATESPLATLYRDLLMFARQDGTDFKISKTAAALHYWLDNERNDLPMEITKMSFASFNTPITDDGTLPVKLFGRKLNLNRLKEKKIPWLICYGDHDDLVEPPAALAPLDHIEAEVTAFPKGHVAIATSWSDPSSACALHTRFGDRQQRGPVRFQLDLEKAVHAKAD